MGPSTSVADLLRRTGVHSREVVHLGAVALINQREIALAGAGGLDGDRQRFAQQRSDLIERREVE